LDAGCGWRVLGEDLEKLEEALVTTARFVVGADATLSSLKKHRNIPYLVCANIDVLPFRDHSFNLITCNMVVEHLKKPEESISEMARLLSPNGILVIHTPNAFNHLVLANILAGKLLPRKLVLKLVRFSDSRDDSDIFPACYRANSVRKLRRILEKNGLRQESLRILTSPQPYFRFFAPLALLELLWMKATMLRPFQRFGATILLAARARAENLSSPAQKLKSSFRS
jgi:ubiquinone/menaquinone biosynthesis C-methylase UbiE